MTRASGSVAVIGGGFGGLSAAGALAAAGFTVRLFEASDRLGGKAGFSQADGVEFDTGPSLMTMPHVAESWFRSCGTRLEDHVTLRRLSPAFTYLWPDGVSLDVDHDLEVTLAAVQQVLGAQARRELQDFLAYAKQIWDASADAFVMGDAPSLGGMMRMSLRTLAGLRHIDATRSMEEAITARVKDRRLRDILRRYATYNGSDVRCAPATLNCIAWVELGLGSWGVSGGMSALAMAMATVAQSCGAEVSCGAPVSEIVVKNGRARGVVAEGVFHEADVVVCNADATHLFRSLLPDVHRPQLRTSSPSMSGWNAVYRVKRRASVKRYPHSVSFAPHYLDEFAAIFDRGEITAQPTVYACNQQLAHGRDGWEDSDALFVMVNAPSVSARRSTPDWDRLDGFVRATLARSGLMDDGAQRLWSRTPDGLQARFPGSDGALYGDASNSPFSAFRRPANRSPLVQGLYLAGGSAHPGGGVPMCILSGVAAGRAALSDMSGALPSSARRAS